MLSPQDDFRPLSFFGSGHNQTILGVLTSFPFDPPSRTYYVHLPDRDLIAIEITTPINWRPSDPTVVMVHGLCGSHKSNYLVRLAGKLYNRGIQAIRVNLRGCGSGRGLARYIYHSGSSEDINYVLKDVKHLFPESPITLAGFSLGGNIVLKLMGELGDAGKDLVKNVIAVSPPANLRSSVIMFGHPQNRKYEKYFIKLLRADIHYRHEKFNLPKVDIPLNMSVFEFDEYYIAPQIGYKSALEYYRVCGSRDLIPSIAVPCNILFAKDDPIIDPNSVDGLDLPSHIQVFKTEKGGHLGYLGSPFHPAGIRWMDYTLLKWIEEKNPRPS